MITNADCTIYNKYLQSGSEKYQRTVIYDVTWENRKAANVLASGGNIAANAARVFILFERGADYLKPKAWLALVSKTGKWTLAEGDIVVKGVVTDEITGGFTITNLKAKYDDCFTVASVDTMDIDSECMWHWNVGLK